MAGSGSGKPLSASATAAFHQPPPLYGGRWQQQAVHPFKLGLGPAVAGHRVVRNYSEA